MGHTGWTDVAIRSDAAATALADLLTTAARPPTSWMYTPVGLHHIRLTPPMFTPLPEVTSGSSRTSAYVAFLPPLAQLPVQEKS